MRFGLTPRRLEPIEFREVLQWGIGLTDIGKTRSGSDREIGSGGFDVPGLIEKLEECQPLEIAFTSKRAASEALGHRTEYGEQPEPFAGRRSTSCRHPREGRGASGIRLSGSGWPTPAAHCRAAPLRRGSSTPAYQRSGDAGQDYDPSVAVDVGTEIVIARPRADVAAYVIELISATEWYANIRSVAWENSMFAGRRLALRVRAQFLGRGLEYTYEVRELVPGERFVMSTSQGPFPMETTYAFADADGGTRMKLRNRGEPSGFSKVGAPMTAAAMRRANRADLARIREILADGRRQLISAG